METDRPSGSWIRKMSTPKREKIGDHKYWTCTVSGIDGKSWVVPIGKPFTSTHLELDGQEPLTSFVDLWVYEYIISTYENKLTFYHKTNCIRPLGNSYYEGKDKVRKYQFYRMIYKPRGVIQPTLWKD